LAFQILSVTCDNASNNDKMVEHLATLIDHFPGAANQTRCFSHILNLAAKSILRQFDASKKNNAEDSEDVGEAANVLEELTRELELDEVTEDDDDEAGEDLDNEDDEQPNELDGMSEGEALELERSLLPVRLMLAKVISRFQTIYYPILILLLAQLRALSNAIKNSSTILLPIWNTKLEDLGLNIRMMPRDVATRWNSTFDMLDFAIDYRAAIDDMTSIRDLRKYELENDEWDTAVNLRDTLKACCFS